MNRPTCYFGTAHGNREHVTWARWSYECIQIPYLSQLWRDQTGVLRPIPARPTAPNLFAAEIRDMITKNVVELATTDREVLIEITAKKNSSLRFCIDCRILNAVMIRDSHTPLRMVEFIDKSEESAGLSALLASSWYQKIVIYERHRVWMFLISRYGLYRLTSTPFELKIASERLQKVMDSELVPMRCLFVMLCLDKMFFFQSRPITTLRKSVGSCDYCIRLLLLSNWRKRIYLLRSWTISVTILDSAALSSHSTLQALLRSSSSLLYKKNISHSYTCLTFSGGSYRPSHVLPPAQQKSEEWTVRTSRPSWGLRERCGCVMTKAIKTHQCWS